MLTVLRNTWLLCGLGVALLLVLPIRSPADGAVDGPEQLTYQGRTAQGQNVIVGTEDGRVRRIHFEPLRGACTDGASWTFTVNVWIPRPGVRLRQHRRRFTASIASASDPNDAVTAVMDGRIGRSAVTGTVGFAGTSYDRRCSAAPMGFSAERLR